MPEAVRVAASRQSGAAPLFADAEQGREAAERCPRPCAPRPPIFSRLRVPLDEKLTASDVKQAFVRSGVLFEPRLAVARTAAPADAEILTPAPANDLKAALLVLRQVAKVWSASEPAPSRVPASTLPVTAPRVRFLCWRLRRCAASAPMPSMAASETIRHVANALAGVPDELIPQSAPLSPEQATKLAKTLASVLEARDPHTASPDMRSNGTLPPPYRGAPLAAQPPARRRSRRTPRRTRSPTG